MNMTELREEFAAWPFCDPTSHEILAALKDPAPITEAGLRELGFLQDGALFHMGRVQVEHRGIYWHVCNHNSFWRIFASMGQLRRLLLSVGE